MAKKILSILCALTMLVTMVSVAAFSASAAETTTINLLDSTNISKWSIVRQTGSHSWHMMAGAVDMTERNLTGIDGGLVFLTPNTRNAADRYLDFNYSDAVAFGDDFSILMTGFINGNLLSNMVATSDSFIALNLGDYSVRLVRYVEDAAKEANYGRHNLSVALYKNDVCVAATDALSPNITTTLYNGKPVTNAIADDNTSEFETNVNTSLFLKNACTSSNGTISKTAANFKNDENWKDINIVVNNSIMTISDAGGNVLITEAVAADAFASVTPSVRIYNDDKVMATASSAVFRLEGVINETTASTEPQVRNFSFLSDNTETSISSTMADGSTWSENQCGIYDSKALGSYAMVVKQLGIAAPLGNYSVGDSFNIAYDYIRTNHIGRGPSTQTDGSVLHSYQSVISLGKLTVEVICSANGPKFETNIYYDGKLVQGSGGYSDWGATTMALDSDEWNALFSTAMTDGETYDGELFNEFPSAVGSTYSTKDMLKRHVSISYSNGTVTVVEGNQTTQATIENADFSDAALSVSLASSVNAASIVYGLTGSYTEFVYNANSDENLKPYGASLTVNDSLAVNFIYEAEQVAKLAADYTNFSAVATVDGYSDKTVTFTEADIDSALGSDGKYYFTVDLITPDLFSKDIVFTVTATKKTGGAAATYVDRYSVRDYCVNMINSEESYATDNLKNLCYSILEYGEATREYMKGNDLSTTNLSVNKGLNITGAWIGKKWVAASETDWNKGEVTGNVAIVDAVMNLAGNVGIKYGVTVAGDASEYKVVFDAADKVLVNEDAALVADGERQMAIARVYAYNMDAPITAVVKDASNESVSNTYTTSVEGWVLKSIDVGNLTPDLTYGVFVEMLTYGNAAKAYAVEIGLITVA